MKRIAIAVENNNGLDSSISGHFGQCSEYLVVEVEDNSIAKEYFVKNPYFGQHGACVIPGFIKEQAADVMIAGGMGAKAAQLFSEYGIEVITGASGVARDALNSYLEGNLKGFEPCTEHSGC